MPSYFTPPPPGGAQWTQSPMPVLPRHARPASVTHQANASNTSISPSSPANTQLPMYAMMAMMQQMQQNYSHNMPQQQHQFPQSQSQQQPPTLEQPKMPTPQPSDNSLLAQIIYEQTKRGLSYKAALESLHGHNGIMAFAWKDYFLENKQTIDDLVDQLRGYAPSTATVTIKQRSLSPTMGNGSRTSPNTEGRQSQSHVRPQLQPRPRLSQLPHSDNASRKGEVKEITPTRVVKIKREKVVNEESNKGSKETERDSSSRRTLNSLSSAPSNDLLAKVPPAVAIDIHTGLPAAPSRSPSPPSATPNSRYTEQDAIFFFRRIAYDLARDPDLSKANLCELLGEKAPHHSSVSWRSYWQKHEDVADKMYLLTQLDEEDREKAIQSWKTGTPANTGNGRSRSAARRVSYKESSDSDISEAGSDSSSLSSNSEKKGSGSSEGEDDAQGSTDEEEELGESGSPFTITETRVLARHIASVPDWFKGHKEWESFCSAYPQRSAAAWREYYRRKGGEIDALAKKYIRKAKKGRGAVTAQRGRPSWARQSSPRATSSVSESIGLVKRKFADEVSREQSEEKRTKLEDLLGST